jgi:competence protein ComEC
LRLLARYFALSLAAWIGSIPLSALYFHLFSPISPLANIVAVPLGTLALMSNLGSLVCGGWLSWATELFNYSAWFFMLAMTRVSELAAKIPGAFFYVPAPSWLDIAIYYAALVGALSGWLFARPRRIWSAAILVLLAAFYFWRWEQSRQETELTVLPLNGGHCVFVDGPGRKNDWLVNCGDADAVEFTLKPFLRARGVNHISRLALAHGGARNSSGAEPLNGLFGIGELVTGPVPFRSGACRDLVARFDKPPARHTVIHRGDHAGGWQVLHPGAGDNFAHRDDAALVLLGNLCGARVLLLSDLGRSGQSTLLANTNGLRADVVIAGLPDEGEPLCDALLDAVQPKVIVVADSEFPANRRPNPKLRERLGQKGIPVIYTRTAGAVTMVTRPNGWEVRAMDGQKFSSAASSK